MKWMDRCRAAAWHLLASILIASLAAMLVFVVWFPYPYREVSGGRELFGLIVAVDVILGPLLTFIVFNRSKPRAELWRDLTVVVLLQVAALGYGLWTVDLVRPIYLVHEVDRFKVVTLADIDQRELPQALAPFRNIPLHGIRVIGVRKSQDSKEMFSAVASAIEGRDISAMPSRWQELDDANRAQIRTRARDIVDLRVRARDDGVALDRLLADAGLKDSDVIALPLVSRRDDWAVLMRRVDLHIIGYLPIEAW